MVNKEIFMINVIGKSGHSSIPYYCKNPISIGSKIITEISSIHSQKINQYIEKYIMGISDFNRELLSMQFLIVLLSEDTLKRLMKA